MTATTGRRHTAAPASIVARVRLVGRRGRFGWITGVALFTLFIVSLYGSVRDNSALRDALDNYPPALRQLFSMNDYTSGPGYLRAEVFSLTAPFLLLIPAILWGAGRVADEEESRTIDLLASVPLGRRRILGEIWLATVVDLGALALTLAVTLVACTAAFHVEVAIGRQLSAVFATFLLAVVFATVSATAAAATGRTGLSRGIGAAAAIGAYLLSSFAELIDGLRPFRVLSPWYHGLGVNPIGRGLLVGHVAVLVAVVAALLVVADRAYARRDLGT